MFNPLKLKKIMKKIVVAFGENACSFIDEHQWKKAVEEGGGSYVVKEFETDAEIEAYLQGLSDADGWWDFKLLSKSDIKALSRYTKIV